MLLALVQGLGPDFQYDPQEMSINPYSEIDTAYGSTLIILITSNHFRMTQTWMMFPGHYGHVYSHCTLICPKRATNPDMPFTKSTKGLSTSQTRFINKVVTKWTNTDKHRSVFKNSEDRKSFFGNCVLIWDCLILNMLPLPYCSQAHRGQNLDPIQRCITQTVFCT